MTALSTSGSISAHGSRIHLAARRTSTACGQRACRTVSVPRLGCISASTTSVPPRSTSHVQPGHQALQLGHLRVVPVEVPGVHVIGGPLPGEAPRHPAGMSVRSLHVSGQVGAQLVRMEVEALQPRGAQSSAQRVPEPGLPAGRGPDDGHQACLHVDETGLGVGVDCADEDPDHLEQGGRQGQHADRLRGLGVLAVSQDRAAMLVADEEGSTALAFDGDEADIAEIDDVADPDAEDLAQAQTEEASEPGSQLPDHVQLSGNLTHLDQGADPARCALSLSQSASFGSAATRTLRRSGTLRAPRARACSSTILTTAGISRP